MNYIATLDIDDGQHFHGKFKHFEKGYAIAVLTLNQHPPIGGRGRLYIQPPAPAAPDNVVVGEGVVSAVIASQGRFQVGVRIKRWSDNHVSLFSKLETKA